MTPSCFAQCLIESSKFPVKNRQRRAVSDDVMEVQNQDMVFHRQLHQRSAQKRRVFEIVKLTRVQVEQPIRLGLRLRVRQVRKVDFWQRNPQARRDFLARLSVDFINIDRNTSWRAMTSLSACSSAARSRLPLTRNAAGML